MTCALRKPISRREIGAERHVQPCAKRSSLVACGRGQGAGHLGQFGRMRSWRRDGRIGSAAGVAAIIWVNWYFFASRD